MRTLADDPHFGVREWAWLALRADIVTAPLQALEHLQPWTQETSPYLRRFACEALRPRGVWATHIAPFKQHPQQALPLLEALADDPERYVQDSVGNWLNDAGKTQPQWLRDLCVRWQHEHPGAANAYIRKRASGSLRLCRPLAGNPGPFKQAWHMRLSPRHVAGTGGAVGGHSRSGPAAAGLRSLHRALVAQPRAAGRGPAGAGPRAGALGRHP
ncbi:hypothetical protein G6F68_012678 [Rhizopus microsporus]|nr:hypothetical protein G6F68_012678 [Rhizopus microsporus]